MAEISVLHDVFGQSLVVWFGDPNREVVCDHTDSDVVIMLDEEGRALGIEVLGFRPLDSQPLTVSLKVVDTSKPRVAASA
jgi:L-rhamnose isomerase